MHTNRKMLVAGLILGLSIVSLGVTAQPGEVTGAKDQVEGAGFRTGHKVPDDMLTDDNIVKNYHRYHLRKPPDGYEWVHAGNTGILLVSIKSHIVARIESRPNIAPESK